MNRRWRASVAALVLSSLPAGYLCAADGPYLGAGLGVTTVRDDIDTGGTFDADDGSYRAFAGWRFDAVPIIDLAVEAAYTQFGKPSQNVAGEEARYKLRGPSAAGLLIVPLGPIDLYGKAGVLWWSLDRDLGASSLSRSGSDPFYGAGIGFYLWKIGIRAEYERFQVKDVDRVQMLSVNALFQF
jgi:OOP family OmpA-OmpF porin